MMIGMREDGYSNNDVLYAWPKSGKDPVGREEGVNLAQYDLTEIKTTEEIRLSSRRGNSFFFICVYFAYFLAWLGLHSIVCKKK